MPNWPFLSRESGAVKTLEQLRDEFKDRLDDMNDEEWRKLFIALDLQVHVRDASGR